MILRDVEKELMKSRDDDGFVYPRYDGYSLSNVPYSIMDMLGVKHDGQALKPQIMKNIELSGINKVVLLFLDGLGYDMLLKSYKDGPFFKKFVTNGTVSPLTTVFPSTTANAETTINTGLMPLEHGLPEWTLYFKEIRMAINTLPFSSLAQGNGKSLVDSGFDPRILYRGPTVYKRLKKQGVDSFTFVSKDIYKSPYSSLVRRGSKELSYINPTDMAVKLRKALEREKGTAYFEVYISTVDAITHSYGPHTEESHAEISVLSYLFGKHLLEKISNGSAEETLVIVNADHGHIDINPKKMIYLNRYKWLEKAYAIDKSKKIIPPTGGMRDVFLHIKEDMLEETKNYLADKLRNIAKVMKTEEAIKMGLFGLGRPRKRFNERIGNLLVLPYKNNSVWYQHIRGKKIKFSSYKVGAHGGLSRNEMLIPFAAARLSDLK